MKLIISKQFQTFIEGVGFSLEYVLERAGIPNILWKEELELSPMEYCRFLSELDEIITDDHLLYGSDYPYVAEPMLIGGKRALEERLASHGLSPQDVFTDNARRLFTGFATVSVAVADETSANQKIVRLAEIEVEPSMLEEYLAFAKEVGETSTKVEPGVLTLFSMQAKEDPCKIYILEIYSNQAAYQSHIQTAHFKKYKEGTAKMVKSLKLIDTMPLVGTGNMVK